MKNTFLSLLFLIITSLSFAQKTAIEKSVTGVQVGFFGANLYNETRLTNTISVRSEIGLTSGAFGGSRYKKTVFILLPFLSIYQKWYYNFDKRIKANKNVKNNAANYLSLGIFYAPDWFTISNKKNISINSSFSIIPTWGLRRNFAKNFNYEFKIGLGYGISFRKPFKNTKGVVFDLGFKIGYDF